MKSAFRNLRILKQHWRYLIMKACSPIDGLWYYFIDKCLPFGAAISCSHFQCFSDAIAHIVHWKTYCVLGVDKPLVNYLDNFLFVIFFTALCNGQIQIFLDICDTINFPVSFEKNVLGNDTAYFLGVTLRFS